MPVAAPRGHHRDLDLVDQVVELLELRLHLTPPRVGAPGGIPEADASNRRSARLAITRIEPRRRAT
jgi:hypothetical protein